MSKTKKQTKGKTGYVAFLYAGIIKNSHIRLMFTEKDIGDEFASYKQYYSNDVRGRFIKSETPEEDFQKVVARMEKDKLRKDADNFIFEVSVSGASTMLREATGAKKLSMLGNSAEKTDKDDEEEVDDKEKSKKDTKDAKKDDADNEDDKKKDTKKEDKKKDDSDDEDDKKKDDSDDEKVDKQDDDKDKKAKGKGKEKAKKETKPKKESKAKK